MLLEWSHFWTPQLFVQVLIFLGSKHSHHLWPWLGSACRPCDGIFEFLYYVHKKYCILFKCMCMPVKNKVEIIHFVFCLFWGTVKYNLYRRRHSNINRDFWHPLLPPQFLPNPCYNRYRIHVNLFFGIVICELAKFVTHRDWCILFDSSQMVGLSYIPWW